MDSDFDRHTDRVEVGIYNYTVNYYNNSRQKFENGLYIPVVLLL